MERCDRVKKGGDDKRVADFVSLLPLPVHGLLRQARVRLSFEREGPVVVDVPNGRGEGGVGGGADCGRIKKQGGVSRTRRGGKE